MLDRFEFEANVDGAPGSSSLLGTTSRRICHVCGVHATPQPCCPSCGHPMCGRCVSEKMAANGSNCELGDVTGNGAIAEKGLIVSLHFPVL